MTVEEAVELVVQAGAVGRDGEVLVLDMGDPVRIAEVARLAWWRQPSDPLTSCTRACVRARSSVSSCSGKMRWTNVPLTR